MNITRRQALGLAFLALFGAWALGAPVPTHRPKPLTPPLPPPAPQVTCGGWILTWDEVRGVTSLEPAHGYSWQSHTSLWVGSWSWDGNTRTLSVDEHVSTDPGNRLVWQVALDENLAGVVKIDGSEIRVTLRQSDF